MIFEYIVADDDIRAQVVDYEQWALFIYVIINFKRSEADPINI
jgi:hypothetical protein